MATNLFGRGMDIERVNIAFNYDMPEDSDTYLHRVGSDHVTLSGKNKSKSEVQSFINFAVNGFT